MKESKTVIITGANSGLGLWTTRYLLNEGFKVIMACRNIQKASKILLSLPNINNGNCKILPLDLGDLRSLEHFVTLLPENEDIYALDCNAGVTYEGSTRYTKDGIEETFGVNHIGHFYLTNLLLNKYDIKKIIIISSALHDPAIKSPFPKPDLCSVQEMAFPTTEPKSAYSTSKLCNIFFLMNLVDCLMENAL